MMIFSGRGKQPLATFVAILLLIGFTRICANEPVATIDAYVTKAASRDSVALSEPVDDGAFLRRVSLDLLGRIPTEIERKRFLASPSREALVDVLLRHDGFPLFWSRLWTSMVIGYGQPRQADRECLRGWLEEQFLAQRPLDELVSELIAAEGRASQDGPANFMLRHARDGVVPVGRLFLGVQLDCARCHDHPTDRWSQDDVASMQRFFDLSQVRQPVPGTYLITDRQPGPGQSKPRFLTGAQPLTGRWRAELSLHVVRSKPFARAMADRLWYHFFGRGVTGPPDAVNANRNHQDFAFVEFLGSRLKGHQFQLRPMIRELCLSEAYQRQVSTEHSEYSLMPTYKPLTPNQLYDSMLIAMDQAEQPGQRAEFTRMVSDASLDDTIANAWQLREATQSLLQRLNMPIPRTRDSNEELFERVLCRAATAVEHSQCKGQTPEDVLFALVHSNEFSFWH